MIRYQEIDRRTIEWPKFAEVVRILIVHIHEGPSQERSQPLNMTCARNQGAYLPGCRLSKRHYFAKLHRFSSRGYHRFDVRKSFWGLATSRGRGSCKGIIIGDGTLVANAWRCARLLYNILHLHHIQQVALQQQIKDSYWNLLTVEGPSHQKIWISWSSLLQQLGLT